MIDNNEEIKKILDKTIDRLTKEGKTDNINMLTNLAKINADLITPWMIMQLELFSNNEELALMSVGSEMFSILMAFSKSNTDIALSLLEKLASDTRTMIIEYDKQVNKL